MRTLSLYSELQPGLPLGDTACRVCRYALLGRCDAVPTRSSYLARGRGVVGCHDAVAQSRMANDLYGRFVEPGPSSHGQLQLPQFIPAIQDGIGGLGGLCGNRVFAVYLKSILKPSGSVRFDEPGVMRRALGLSEDDRVGLIASADDHLMERFWRESDAQDAWRRVAGLKFDFATSFAFSSWETMPRWDQIYNIDRGLITYDLLTAHGVSTIPFVLLDCSHRDREYSLQWVSERSDVDTVAVLTQCRKRPSEWAQILDEMASFSRDVGRKIRFAVVGPSTPARINSVLAHFPSSTIITADPFQKALHGREVLASGRSRANHFRDFASIAVSNIDWYVRQCRIAAQGTL